MQLVTQELFKDLTQRLLKFGSLILIALIIITIFATLSKYSGANFKIHIIMTMVLAKIPKLFVMATILGYFIAICSWRHFQIATNQTIARTTFGYGMYSEITGVIWIGIILATLNYISLTSITPQLHQYTNHIIQNNADQIWQDRINAGGWINSINKKTTIWAPASKIDSHKSHNKSKNSSTTTDASPATNPSPTSKLPYILFNLPELNSNNFKVIVAQQLNLTSHPSGLAWQGNNLKFYNLTLGQPDGNISKANIASGILKTPKTQGITNLKRDYNVSTWNLGLSLTTITIGIIGFCLFVNWNRRKSEIGIICWATAILCTYLATLTHVRSNHNSTEIYLIVHTTYSIIPLLWARYQYGQN